MVRMKIRNKEKTRETARKERRKKKLESIIQGWKERRIGRELVREDRAREEERKIGNLLE